MPFPLAIGKRPSINNRLRVVIIYTLFDTPAISGFRNPIQELSDPKAKRSNNPKAQRVYSPRNNFFNSVASFGFIFPAKIKLNCFLRNAPSKRNFSSSVSGINSGTSIGPPF